MTKNVIEKAIVSYLLLFHSNFAKSTASSNAKPYNTCDQMLFLRFLLAGQSISSKSYLWLDFTQNNLQLGRLENEFPGQKLFFNYLAGGVY